MLPFPFRLSKRKAEGGLGGNSAFLLPNQNEASPATLQFIARHHRKILFSLGERKIQRAQNEKSKEYFSVVWRACRAVAGLASLVGVLLKESSNISQKTPPDVQVRTLGTARVFEPLPTTFGGSNLDNCKSIRTSKTGVHIGVSF